MKITIAYLPQEKREATIIQSFILGGLPDAETQKKDGFIYIETKPYACVAPSPVLHTPEYAVP